MIQAFIVSFLGETTADDWSQRRAAPPPWAELEFDNIILTVPSKAVRDLEQVDELAKVWNNIMKTIAELATTPLKFPRKERIVIDVQISRGKHVRVRSNNSQLTQISSHHPHGSTKVFIQGLLDKQARCMPAIPSWDRLPQPTSSPTPKRLKGAFGVPFMSWDTTKRGAAGNSDHTPMSVFATCGQCMCTRNCWELREQRYQAVLEVFWNSECYCLMLCGVGSWGTDSREETSSDKEICCRRQETERLGCLDSSGDLPAGETPA